jgi:hypothetical protein
LYTSTNSEAARVTCRDLINYAAAWHSSIFRPTTSPRSVVRYPVGSVYRRRRADDRSRKERPGALRHSPPQPPLTCFPAALPRYAFYAQTPINRHVRSCLRCFVAERNAPDPSATRRARRPPTILKPRCRNPAEYAHYHGCLARL